MKIHIHIRQFCIFLLSVISTATLAGTLTIKDLSFPIRVSDSEVGLYSITNNSPSTHTNQWYGNDSNAVDINLNYYYGNPINSTNKTYHYNRDAGKDVVAIADGEIVSTGSMQSNYGWVLVKHTTPIIIGGITYTEWSSGYMHMNITKSAGTVSKGEVIGTVGRVGATNDHLHFAIYQGAKYQKDYLVSLPIIDNVIELQDNQCVVSEVHCLMRTSHQTSWGYFQDPTSGWWYISNSYGNTYALGRNSQNHSAWITIGNFNLTYPSVASLDFVSKRVNIIGNTNTANNIYNAISVVDGSWEIMRNDQASRLASTIQGRSFPISWFFFQVESSGKWYIVNVSGSTTSILRLQLTSDYSQYDWQQPVNEYGTKVNTSNIEREFYQGSDGAWRVRFTPETIIGNF